MPSVTSSFNGLYSPTLMGKNLRRFWPLWGLYGLGLFFVLPAQLLSNLYSYWVDVGLGYGVSYTLGSELLPAIQAAPATGAIYGLVCAMALFYYLMDHRATQMLHALPIRREGLFLTNWLSGLLFILVPNLAIALICLLCAGAAGAMGLALREHFVWYLLLWLGAQTVIPMFFFCFALCCAMFTGNLQALPVFYGILNFLVLGVFVLVAEGLLPNLLAGYAGSVPDWCRWFTPLFHLQSLVGTWRGYGILEAICYSLVVGCAFTLIALGVYRLRQLERAGDLVTVGWVRPVFQYGFALCVGLTGGIFVWGQFFRNGTSWSLMALVVAFAVLGAFAGRMLLKKTLRVFADGWKGVAVMAAALALLLVGIRADFFGYQHWVPKPETVESVDLYSVRSYPRDGGTYNDCTITDARLIEQVSALHTGLVDHLDRVAPDSAYMFSPMVQAAWDFETQGITGLGLRYTLKNGETVTRWYDSVPIYQSELEQAGTYARALEELLNEPELIRDAYLDDHDPARLEAVDGWLENLRPALTAPEETAPEETAQTEFAPTLVQADRDVGSVLTPDQARQVWAAVREDLEAGRIGRRYLLDNAQRREKCYYTDIYLSLAYTVEREDGSRHSGTITTSFTIQTTSTSTLKALEELGYRDRLARRADDMG